MFIARVIGKVTLAPKDKALVPGRFVIVETLDAHAVTHVATFARRRKPMPRSMVIFDNLGAGVGQVVAVADARAGCRPFQPGRVPVDAYCSAILDTLEQTYEVPATD